MSDDGFTALMHRLSVRQNRHGLINAIHSLITIAELEEAEHEIEDTLHVVGHRRELWTRTFLEWIREGWREIL